MRIILSLLIALLVLLMSPLSALAVTVPTFPSCINPQGSVKAKYDSGTHGIAGDMSQYTGNDTVYRLTDSTLLQCFCPADGSGIQTNWWKAAGLTDQDIAIMKRQGWIYIPNGSLWGLDEAPYLAYNSTYACGPRQGNVQGDYLEDPKLAGTGLPLPLYALLGMGIGALVLGIVSLTRRSV